MEKVKCALCNSDNYKIMLKAKDYRCHVTADDFNLVQCKECGLVYVNPRPSKEEIKEFYPYGYYPSGDFMTKTVKYLLRKEKIRQVKKYKKRGKLLDVGCGDGDFLFGMSGVGFEVFGVDTSAEAVKLARQKLRNKDRIYNCELRGVEFPDKFFDVVTLFHVLEHLPHPHQELLEINRILKDNGILILSMPDIDSFAFNVFKKYWFCLDIPRHLYHFSTKTIRDMLGLAGFQVVRITRFSLGFPFSLFHSALNWLKDYDMSPLLVWLLFVSMFPFLFLLTLISLILSFSGRGQELKLEAYCTKKDERLKTVSGIEDDKES